MKSYGILIKKCCSSILQPMVDKHIGPWTWINILKKQRSRCFESIAIAIKYYMWYYKVYYNLYRTACQPCLNKVIYKRSTRVIIRQKITRSPPLRQHFHRNEVKITLNVFVRISSINYYFFDFACSVTGLKEHFGSKYKFPHVFAFV